MIYKYVNEDNYSEEERIKRKLLFYLHSNGFYGEGHCSVKELQHNNYIDGKVIDSKKFKDAIKSLISAQILAKYGGKKRVYIADTKTALKMIEDLIENRKKI